MKPPYALLWLKLTIFATSIVAIGCGANLVRSATLYDRLHEPWAHGWSVQLMGFLVAVIGAALAWSAIVSLFVGSAKEARLTTDYGEVFGEGFPRLFPAVQEAHIFPLKARGTATVTRRWATSWLASLMRMPPAAVDIPVELDVRRDSTGLVWKRDFGGHSLTTTQVLFVGGIVERTALSEISFTATERDGIAVYESHRCSLLGINVPRILSPDVVGVVSADGEGWRVSVSIAAPLVGLICAYTARMKRL